MRLDSRRSLRVLYSFEVAPLAGETKWACGAAGSAPAWHAGGQGFESPQVHHFRHTPARAQASTEELTSNNPTLVDDSGRFRRELVWVNGDDADSLNAELNRASARARAWSSRGYARVHATRRHPDAREDRTRTYALRDDPPLVDGNSRTGRAIVRSPLRRDGITLNLTFPLSAGLLTDTEAYFRHLTAYRPGDAAPIIRRFAIAARYPSSTESGLVDDLADQLDEARERLGGVRSSSRA